MKTSYSRRELYEFGETLGESVTRKEGGRTIYGGGGSGGGGGPSSQTVTNDLPAWAQPYAKDVLGKGAALAESPYQAYGGERQAQFTPLQQQAFQGAGSLAPSAALGQGVDIAGQAAQRAMGVGTQYNPLQASFMETQAPQLQQFQMGPAERVRADTFGGRQAAQYMSPFMEQALAPQLREAQRSSEMQRNVNQAQAVQQGAFGGSRQAIVEAERQRNLGTQMGDIRARGLQSAFEQAQQQFNQDAARRMQSQQLNQQAGLTVGGQNLQALLGTQQLDAQTGMQSQLANQQAFQNARQLSEQSRQYGAGLGLQGLQTALTGAGQLGALGQQQFGQQKDVLGLQNQFGTQQQQQVQSMLGQQYEDFLNQKRFPYQQLEFQSNLLRGTPSGSTQSMYQAPPSTASQIIGAGTALYGASRMAKGGPVADAPVKREKKKSAGLAELALSKI